MDNINLRRARQDADYAAECRRLLDDRAKLIVERYAKDAAEAETLYWQAIALAADAEGKYTAAAKNAKGLRGALYRVAGYRGPRPAVLKKADDLEQRAREHYLRCEAVVDAAKKAMRIE